MAVPQDFVALDTYRNLMIEAKSRASCLQSISNDQRGIPSPLVLEFASLQVRMLCEIFALSCLIAHGDLVEQTQRSLRKSYKPGEILPALEGLDGRFFPVAMHPVKTNEGWHMDHYSGGLVATKSEIPKIRNQCGDILHRGNLAKLVSDRSPAQKRFSDISEWTAKIHRLLNNPYIKRQGGKVPFVALGVFDGAVQVVLADRSTNLPSN